MRKRLIRPASAPVRVILRAAPSKSATHRALVCAALANGPSRIVRPLDADDTRATAEGLRRLGIPVDIGPASWSVEGTGGAIPGGGTLDLRESGSSLRFLLAVSALGRVPSRLDGSPRLRERPLAELAAVLEALGARVDLLGPGRRLPAVAGGRAMRGGAIRVPASQSSQFASSILMVGAGLPGGVSVTLAPPAVSIPYVELTVEILRRFGAAIDHPDELTWTVEPKPLRGTEYSVEGDHSSASYFFAAAAITGGVVRVEGLDPASRQPDARFPSILSRLGCEVGHGPDWIEVRGAGRIRAFDEDVSDAPDLAPTLAAVALFAEGRCTLRGVAHLRLKESDRVAAIASALSTLGAAARAHDDRLEIEAPAVRADGGLVETHGDHRIAMAFAVAGLRRSGLSVDDAECVGKSYPGFWDDFAALEEAAGESRA